MDIFFFVRRVFTLFILGMMLLIPVTGYAQIGTENAACKAQKITLANLFDFRQNFPIIPEACSLPGGEIAVLSPQYLTSVAIRAYAFVLSLAFTLITPSLIGVGLFYMYSGVDSSQAAVAKRWANNLGVALFMSIFAFVVPITIAGLLAPQLTNVDLSEFFTFETYNSN